jgi:hypothetical protein
VDGHARALPPRCELDGERTHDRCAGACYLDGADISEVLVHRGLARDCPRYSQGRYAEAELQAAAAGAKIGDDYLLPRVLSAALSCAGVATDQMIARDAVIQPVG